MSTKGKYLSVFILAAIIMTPIGLVAEGSAWGEWSSDEIHTMLGYVPQSIAQAKPLIGAMIPDYAINGFGALASTWLSAVIGVGLVFGVMIAIKKSAKRAS